MPNQKYSTIITDIGTQKIAKAIAEGTKVNINIFAVGDGDGAYYVPTTDMTALKKENWRGAVNQLSVNADSPNVIDIVAIVPTDVGGWTIREAGFFDDEGDMIAICNTPDTAKVIISSGAAGQVMLTPHITVDNTDNVTLLVDPNVITASKQYVDDTVSVHNTDPTSHDGIFASQTQLDGHTGDGDIHTTVAEKTRWNATSDGSSDHYVLITGGTIDRAIEYNRLDGRDNQEWYNIRELAQPQ